MHVAVGFSRKSCLEDARSNWLEIANWNKIRKDYGPGEI